MAYLFAAAEILPKAGWFASSALRNGGAVPLAFLYK